MKVVNPRPSTAPIHDLAIQKEMRQAWTDSQVDDPKLRHEEGGYIVRRSDGTLGVERWPRGAGVFFNPGPRPTDGSTVLGEFHTHPNPAVDEEGRTWQESPNPSDLRCIPEEKYSGDSYVIGHNDIYRVSPTGVESQVGPRIETIGQ